MDNLYRCTPRQTRAFVKEILEAGLVPFVQSSPGMGKSTIMRSIAKELNLKLIDHRLSTSAPEDLSGLPRFNEQGFAEFVPFADLFPVEGMTIPKG
jgi:MoxR-like ATPase